MPSYDFEDEDGRPYEIFLPMSEAPGFGEWREFDGKRLQRVIGTLRTEVHTPDYTCTIRSQARWDPTYPRYNEKGHGVILSKKEYREYQAKNPHLVWD